jgi:hypothetical protein
MLMDAMPTLPESFGWLVKAALLIVTFDPDPGTAAGVQLAAVFQSLLTDPFHV